MRANDTTSRLNVQSLKQLLYYTGSLSEVLSRLLHACLVQIFPFITKHHEYDTVRHFALGSLALPYHSPNY